MNFLAIFSRSKNILFKPAEEWDAIEKENNSTSSAIFGYALPYIIAITLASLTITFIQNHVGKRSFAINNYRQNSIDIAI